MNHLRCFELCCNWHLVLSLCSGDEVGSCCRLKLISPRRHNKSRSKRMKKMTQIIIDDNLWWREKQRKVSEVLREFCGKLSIIFYTIQLILNQCGRLNQQTFEKIDKSSYQTKSNRFVLFSPIAIDSFYPTRCAIKIQSNILNNLIYFSNFAETRE